MLQPIKPGQIWLRRNDHETRFGICGVGPQLTKRFSRPRLMVTYHVCRAWHLHDERSSRKFVTQDSPGWFIILASSDEGWVAIHPDDFDHPSFTRRMYAEVRSEGYILTTLLYSIPDYPNTWTDQ